MKVTLEAQIGVIGGTMGLFSGFSVLSGVEIAYYLGKFMFGKLLDKLNIFIKHRKIAKLP